MRVVVFITLISFLISCDDAQNSEDPSVEPVYSEFVNTWKLVAFIKRSDDTMINYPEELNPTEFFVKSDEELLINGPCNTGGATFSLLPNGRIVVNEIFMTEKACSPVSIMEWEDRIVKSLEMAFQYNIVSDTLTLFSDSEYHLALTRIQS